jgi:hypothetical protein
LCSSKRGAAAANQRGGNKNDDDEVMAAVPCGPLGYEFKGNFIDLLDSLRARPMWRFVSLGIALGGQNPSTSKRLEPLETSIASLRTRT